MRPFAETFARLAGFTSGLSAYCLREIATTGNLRQYVVVIHRCDSWDAALKFELQPAEFPGKQLKARL